MLVLSRKVDQRIRIGDDIEIAVLAIDGDHVKLGIKAPRHIPVLRFELLQDVQEENRRAVAAAATPAALGSVLQGLARLSQGPGAGAAGNAGDGAATEGPAGAPWSGLATSEEPPSPAAALPVNTPEAAVAGCTY